MGACVYGRSIGSMFKMYLCINDYSLRENKMRKLPIGYIKILKKRGTYQGKIEAVSQLVKIDFFC